MSKLCSVCHEIKPASAFWKQTRSKDGLAPSCTSCRTASRKPRVARVGLVNVRVGDNYVLRHIDRAAAECHHDADEPCGGFHWRYTAPGIRNYGRGQQDVEARLALILGIPLAVGAEWWCDSEDLGFSCVSPHHGPTRTELRTASNNDVFTDNGEYNGFNIGIAGETEAEALRLMESPGPAEDVEAATVWIVASGFNDKGEPSTRVNQTAARAWLLKNGHTVPE